MITLVCCFFGRHDKVERVIRCYLNQDYTQDSTLLLYNNSSVPQVLDDIPTAPNQHIILINNHLDLQTGKEYTSVGDIFRDAITFVPDKTTYINFFDSDDIFLPNHISEGLNGVFLGQFSNFRAYKPYRSYYLDGNNKLTLEHNNMEPSVFVDLQYVREKGFFPLSASYHQAWLTPLQRDKQIFQPENGVPTFIYDWGKNHNTHKISGLGDAPENFAAHRRYEVDSGDGVLTPAHKEEVEFYYNLVKTNV